MSDKLHSMLAAVRDRIQGTGASIAQGPDDTAAITVGFDAGEWQALMRELDAGAGEQQAAQALQRELDATAAENQALKRELDAVKSAVASTATAPALASPAEPMAPAPGAVPGTMPPVPDAPLV